MRSSRPMQAQEHIQTWSAMDFTMKLMQGSFTPYTVCFACACSRYDVLDADFSAYHLRTEQELQRPRYALVLKPDTSEHKQGYGDVSNRTP